MSRPEQFQAMARHIYAKAQQLTASLKNSNIAPARADKIRKISNQFPPVAADSEAGFIAETEENFTSYLEKMGLACWIEVMTESPKCIYYFGPFASGGDAESSLEDYLEDLREENAEIVSVEIRRGIPRELTVLEEEMENYLLNWEFSSFVPAWFGI